MFHNFQKLFFYGCVAYNVYKLSENVWLVFSIYKGAKKVYLWVFSPNKKRYNDMRFLDWVYIDDEYTYIV